MRKLAKILKNKKGFTLVEAIAVVAIMGILATVIGGLVTAGTTAYMRQKENAAAKDLGTIVQNEIKRAARSTVEVYLQDGELPRDSNIIGVDDNQTTYTMKNAPTGEYTSTDGTEPAEGEIDRINGIVSNKFTVSAWVLDSDYWRTIFGDNLPPDEEVG